MPSLSLPFHYSFALVCFHPNLLVRWKVPDVKAKLLEVLLLGLPFKPYDAIALTVWTVSLKSFGLFESPRMGFLQWKTLSWSFIVLTKFVSYPPQSERGSKSLVRGFFSFHYFPPLCLNISTVIPSNIFSINRTCFWTPNECRWQQPRCSNRYFPVMLNPHPNLMFLSPYHFFCMQTTPNLTFVALKTVHSSLLPTKI